MIGFILSLISPVLFALDLKELIDQIVVVATNLLLSLGMLCGVYLWCKGVPRLIKKRAGVVYWLYYASFTFVAAFWLYWRLLQKN